MGQSFKQIRTEKQYQREVEIHIIKSTFDDNFTDKITTNIAVSERKYCYVGMFVAGVLVNIAISEQLFAEILVNLAISQRLTKP